MRSRLDTRFHNWWPGTAPSREKANIILDADVVDAIVQKTCATTAIKRQNSAHLVPIESVQMLWTMKPVVSDGPFAGIANVTATSRMKPKMTDTTTDITMPQAAPSEALRVSSLMCADASYPVIVYWERIRPVRKM